MTHIRHATTTFRILSALAAVSLPLAVPSTAATLERDADVAMTQAGLASADVPAMPLMVTAIEVRKEAERLSVAINGEGVLSHEAVRVDERRLVIDIPHASSALRRPTVHVGHRLLKQIRVGDHADKVRLVFDLGRQADYVVEPRGAQLLVTVKDAPAGDSTLDSQVAAMAEADLPPARIERVQEGGKARAVVHRAVPAFRVRPIQMMTEPEAVEKHTPKEDLVVGETRYNGRRISLDFQQADISNVLRLIAEVSGFNIVIGDGVKSKVTMKLMSVPWDQALDMILKMNGLGKIKQGNILWIDTPGQHRQARG